MISYTYNSINPENTFSPTYKRNSNSPSKLSGNSTQPFLSICVEKMTISSEMSSTLNPTKSVSKKRLVPICVAYKGLEGVRSNGVFSYRGDNRLNGTRVGVPFEGFATSKPFTAKSRQNNNDKSFHFIIYFHFDI